MNKTAQVSTPAELGYRVPAEWEPHEGTWMSWPKDPETFIGGSCAAVEMAYATAIRALQKGEKIFLLVNDGASERYVKRRLKELGVTTKNVVFHHIPTADVWTRDYAPTFVKGPRGDVAAVKWKFNGWGGKYPPLMHDDKAGRAIAERAAKTVFRVPIIMEGGAIESNGAGTIVTTEQCLLNKNRNPKLSKAQIEQYVKDYTGASHLIWLKDGVEGDDTDGHVDDIVRFVDEHTVVCAYETNKADRINYHALRENYQLLQHAKTVDGKKIRVIKLPMPDPAIFPKRPFAGPRLPLSYANFYIGNAAVLLPVFGCPADDQAIKIFKKLFPTREIVPLYSVPFVYGAGAIHCATQPQFTSEKSVLTRLKRLIH